MRVAELISSADCSINRLQTTAMIDEERVFILSTQNQLKKISNWFDWDGACNAQLDDHFDYGTYGQAVPRPTPIAGCPSNVIQVHWANDVKS